MKFRVFFKLLKLIYGNIIDKLHLTGSILLINIFRIIACVAVNGLHGHILCIVILRILCKRDTVIRPACDRVSAVTDIGIGIFGPFLILYHIFTDRQEYGIGDKLVPV